MNIKVVRQGPTQKPNALYRVVRTPEDRAALQKQQEQAAYMRNYRARQKEQPR